jgi:hypothetical protein
MAQPSKLCGCQFGKSHAGHVRKIKQELQAVQGRVGGMLRLSIQPVLQ